ncbi:MAG: beta-propeller fold lactonase family protein [Deltaproteobacteria bacterium]|nr:beta-propeller fold lactonase family protein [Deltaproteobacteria bacterium]
MRSAARRRDRGLRAAAVWVIAAGLVADASMPAAAQRLPDPARAAAAVRCQQGLVAGGARLVARRLRLLGVCAGGAFACVQTRPGADGCLAGVRERCVRALRVYETRDVPAVERALRRRCGGLGFADVLAPDGLGQATATSGCGADDAVVVHDVASLARCLVAQHAAEADRLFAARLPRAGELVAVSGVSLGSSSTLPDFGGSGTGLGDRRAAKAVKRCAAAIGRVGDRVVNAELRGVARCGRAVLACVQTVTAAAGAGKPEKVAPTDCLPQAAVACAEHAARAAGVADGVAAALRRGCGRDVLPFDVLRAATGAHLDALASECARHGVASLATLDDYARCLVRQHRCRSRAIVLREAPRARELAAYAGRRLGSGVCADEPASGLASVQAVHHDAAAANGLDGPRAVAVSPDGAHVYVASFDDDALAAFRRDPQDGRVTPVGVSFDGIDGVDGLNGARGLALSPDGAHVYVAGARDDAVAVFARDAGSGVLTFVQRRKNGAGVLDSLNGARAVAVSPDGKHVYVAGDPADAIAVFARDAATGAVTFVARVKNGEGGVSGLHGPYALALSPDGASVYAAAFDDDAVVAFARDAGTGVLSFVGRVKEGENGAAGLDGARALAVAPDGAHVYVAAELARAVVILARDPATGALAPSAVRRHVFGAPDGLGRPDAVVVGGDGAQVFTVSGHDDVVAAFARDAASGAITLAASTVLATGPQSGDPGVLGLALAPAGTELYAVQSTRDVLEVITTQE